MHACVLRMEHDRSALLQPQTARIGQLYYKQHGSISSSCTVLHVHAVKVVKKPISYDQLLVVIIADKFYANNISATSTSTSPTTIYTNKRLQQPSRRLRPPQTKPSELQSILFYTIFSNLFIYSSNKTAENLRYAPPITEIFSASSSGSGSQGSWWSLSSHARYWQHRRVPSSPTRSRVWQAWQGVPPTSSTSTPAKVYLVYPTTATSTTTTTSSTTRLHQHRHQGLSPRLPLQFATSDCAPVKPSATLQLFASLPIRLRGMLEYITVWYIW